MASGCQSIICAQSILASLSPGASAVLLRWHPGLAVLVAHVRWHMAWQHCCTVCCTMGFCTMPMAQGLSRTLVVAWESREGN